MLWQVLDCHFLIAIPQVLLDDAMVNAEEREVEFIQYREAPDAEV
ncbi:hypothetical protein [Schlesneria sp. DSM 10557]